MVIPDNDNVNFQEKPVVSAGLKPAPILKDYCGAVYDHTSVLHVCSDMDVKFCGDVQMIAVTKVRMSPGRAHHSPKILLTLMDILMNEIMSACRPRITGGFFLIVPKHSYGYIDHTSAIKGHFARLYT